MESMISSNDEFVYKMKPCLCLNLSCPLKWLYCSLKAEYASPGLRGGAEEPIGFMRWVHPSWDDKQGQQQVDGTLCQDGPLSSPL